ncbi:MAG: dihydroorotase [Bacteroidetes bacterium]|nr:dihydroorotase [Bacteroidota bacterium]
MTILLKNVKIVDSQSTSNGFIKDILIENGIIKKINKNIQNPSGKTEMIDLKSYSVSPGWVDIFSHFCDPGYEQNETLETGSKAAIHGGYTRVFALPETNPVTDKKTAVEYQVEKAKNLPIFIHPLGAVSKKLEGTELAEMYDMHKSGAIAFTDGYKPLQSTALLIKGLEYIKAINANMIQLPIDKSIAKAGLMHEGIISTRLGLPGIPAMAEKLIIQRDLELLAYTESKLHISGISTAESISLIKKAKKSGLRISCSVTPYHLFFCDEDLQDYDTNLKLSPPLRSRSDMVALRKAVLSGDIDCIATHHQPHDWDEKTKEFEYAKTGMIGLQSCFAVINTLFPTLENQGLVALFSLNARKLFNLPPATIEEGTEAELTIFNRDLKNDFSPASNASKSANSAFFHKELNGKVKGIFAKNKLSIFK